MSENLIIKPLCRIVVLQVCAERPLKHVSPNGKKGLHDDMLRNANITQKVFTDEWLENYKPNWNIYAK